MVPKARIRILFALFLHTLWLWNPSQGFAPVNNRMESIGAVGQKRQGVSHPYPLPKDAARLSRSRSSISKSSTSLFLDLVTYLRTEWISAALFTNQTPRAADVCLQLGTQDGRAVTFIPRTIRQLITSTCEVDGLLPVAVRRQLKQQAERRQGSAEIKYVDQRADNLHATADESVDVVISMNLASKMIENGLDWKKSVSEAARVLKPGGRLLFVEQTDIQGESYVDYIENLVSLTGDVEDAEGERFPIFDDIGYDDIDLVLTPHMAGVAIKSMDAGLTPAERAKKQAKQEKDRIADLSIEAYERGLKKRKRKKKNLAEETSS